MSDEVKKSNGGERTGTAAPPKLGKKDFVSDQDVRWCPGCGDYAILAAVQKVMPDLGVARENIVFISGIGCSSRFPYYMNTYGFHTIHGRAPALATGLKLSRPELMVWVVTGDGDGLSIGGNHFLHALRRNIDLKIMLFNNRIYGLTKGQYSPTSEIGKKTKSTPFGSVDRPMRPTAVAIGADATFVARGVDTDTKGLSEVISRAAAHKGGTMIEILQNCNVFNDGAFTDVTDKAIRDERQLFLEHGKPLLFGKNKGKAIRMRPDFTPEVVEVGDGPGQVPLASLPLHDERSPSSAYAFMLSQLDYPEFPVPMGVFRSIEQPSYEQLSRTQIDDAVAKRGKGDLKKLLHSGMTWTIGGNGERQ